MIKLINPTKLLLSISCFSILAISCSEDNPEIAPKLSDSNAIIELSEITVPPGKKVFFDFNTNSVKDSASSMINLSGMYGSDLKNSRADVYKMGYFDKENTSVEKLTLAEITSSEISTTNSFTIDASSAGAPANGPTWIIYDFKNNHAVYPTANRYIVIYKGVSLNDEADELYLINAASIKASQGIADYSINVKKFIKK